MQKAIVLQDGGWDVQPKFDTTELNEHFAQGWRLMQAFPLITSAIKNIESTENDTFAYAIVLIILEKP